MLTRNREAGKRAQDGVDFATRDPIDLDWLAKLGELVWPEGGGAEIVRLVEECKAGKVPHLTT